MQPKEMRVLFVDDFKAQLELYSDLVTTLPENEGNQKNAPVIFKADGQQSASDMIVKANNEGQPITHIFCDGLNGEWELVVNAAIANCSRDVIIAVISNAREIGDDVAKKAKETGQSIIFIDKQDTTVRYSKRIRSILLGSK